MIELFSPFKLKNFNLSNRFVMPSMSRGWCQNGKPPADMAKYYRRRVEGGIQLVISEGCVVDHPSSSGNEIFARIRQDTVAAWADCISEVHNAGGRMILQITHEGALRKENRDSANPDIPSLSPSGLAAMDKPNGRAATIEELEEIKVAFVQAAKFAKMAGADGIELHGCHGFLLDQFLWAVTNLRDDQYGGDHISERTRFPAEIIAAIRSEVGDDFVIIFRFSQWKEADYKAKIVQTSTELASLLTELSAAGVDVFHVSTRRFFEPEWDGSDLSLAGWVKSLTALPVITVGSVGLNIDVMETLLGDAEAEFTGEVGLKELERRFQNNEFDLVAVGRSVLGDPDWVCKVRDKRYSEINIFSKEHALADLEWETVANSGGKAS